MYKVLLITILLISFSIIAFSQDFEVSPVRINFNAEPGNLQTKTISVINHSNKKSGFSLSLNDFIITANGNREILPLKSSKFSLSDWLNFSPGYFELNPNEEKIISLNLQVPTDDYSARWGILNVQSVQEQNTFISDKGLSAGMRIGTKIAVTLNQSPSSNKNFKIKVRKIEEITSLSDTIRKFSIHIENIGEKITTCKVYLIAANLINADEKIFDPVIADIYPQNNRKLILNLPNILPEGKYALSAIADFGSITNLEGAQIVIDVFPKKDAPKKDQKN